MIHGIRSRYDFRKHYLAPLRTSPATERPPRPPQAESSTRRYRSARERERDRRVREEREETDKLQRSIEKRRLMYEHDLYAKVRLCLWNHLPHDPMLHPEHRVDVIIIIREPLPGSFSSHRTLLSSFIVFVNSWWSAGQYFLSAVYHLNADS